MKKMNSNPSKTSTITQLIQNKKSFTNKYCYIKLPAYNQPFPLVLTVTFPTFLWVLGLRVSLSYKRKGTSCHHPEFFCQEEYNHGKWEFFPCLFFTGMYLFVCFLMRVLFLSTDHELELESCTAHSCASADAQGYC